MSVTPATLAALVIAISFAAGLNVYATILTLGVLARLHWVVLPSGLDVLASWWVIAASTLLFSAEFVADKIPGFDLIWNAAHTFVRVPVALLLAYGATSHLTPELQLLVTALGGVIAAITHGSKLALRGAVTPSPEPVSNIVLSTSEDALAIGVTWTATHHPLVAGSVAAIAVVAAILMAHVALGALRRLWRKLTQRPNATVAVTALLLIAASVHAQTLARPGWVGSGLTAQTWSKHAVLYEIDTRSFQDTNGDGVGDLKGITQHLDYVQALGADAILLEPLTPNLVAGVVAKVPIDPVLGTTDDFDELSLQASRHNLRLLLELPEADPALARFWLTRGIAGFYIPTSAQPNFAANIQAIRKLLAGYTGQRILITDADLAAAPAKASAKSVSVKSAASELLLDSALLKLPTAPASIAADLRTALEQSQTLLRAGTPALVTDGLALPRSLNRFAPAETAAHQADMAKVIAAVLLLNRSVSVIYAGQELGLSSPTGSAVTIPWGVPPAPAATEQPEETEKPAPPPPRPPSNSEAYVPYVPPVVKRPAKPIPPDPATASGQDQIPGSMLNFYRQLIQLHHGKTAVRDGEEIVLNHDDVNALIWVRKPPAPSLQNPAIVIVCNLSAKPIELPLKEELTRLKLRGSFLKTILRSDDAMGSMHLDPATVAPYSAFIGELRY